MVESSMVLQLYAYYLSKYDMEAVLALGFVTRSQAISKISSYFGRENHYLKLRRDEFDVLSGSHRKGWRNREPTKRVLELAEYYGQFDFDQLTEMTKGLLDGCLNYSPVSKNIIDTIETSFSESELEYLINYQDTQAGIRIQDETVKRRILDHSIINQLKSLYRNRCQICGVSHEDEYSASIVEAHHIIPFVQSCNNDAKNIVILCPNHHRLIHKTSAVFLSDELIWQYPNGKREELKLNYHL